ncbi:MULTISPECIES: ROK family transcriptional regulator [Microbacterium]|uniref:ROK family transcriptional regulator n=1 Tax=Microbacterium TaxID=33882 RepID=UPI0028BE8CF9|nr:MULTISPECIES: ROK family transcriptional regulator [Microbacterium]
MNASPPGHSHGPAPAQPGLLRTLNNRVVLDLLIEHDTLTRKDVSTLTGLSKPTASSLLQRLEESGLVRLSGFGETGPGGRAPQLYRINPAAGYAAAVDVRPGRARVRIADIAGSVVMECVEESDRAANGPESAAAIVRSCCDRAGLSPAQLDAIVVSVPGSYDIATDTLSYVDHLPRWQHASVGAELRMLFPDASVAIENDVNLAAIAERHAARGESESFFLFWLDDGVGGAIMIDGALHRGSRGAAGEAAFLLIPGAVFDAESRTDGALERIVGYPALRARAAEAGLEAATAPEALRALLDDPTAAPAVAELCHHYACAIVSVIAVIDPARIVLAGELARLGGERLRAEVARQLAAIMPATPPLTVTVATDTPILDGAMIMSLGIARDRVFTT